jgi:2-haloacid dehalogenase
MQADERQPKVVVFDLGNVLITWDRRLLYRELFDDEAELDHFLDEVYTLEQNERLDRGEGLDDFCRRLAEAHPRYEAEILALRDRWIETIGPVIEGTVEVLRDLKDAGVPCYALSNWNGDTFALVEQHHEFLTWFDGVVLSGREGITKPDPEIFHVLCRRHGFEPESAFFVDDSQTNIDVARSIGMDTELFTGPDTLRHALRGRGLLP